jgi:predicted DNA-binding transcriptional regulator AlpA
VLHTVTYPQVSAIHLVTGPSASRTTLVGMPPEYVGLSEIAKMLGVSRMTASRYTKRPDFPRPSTSSVADIAPGRIWTRKQVDVWAAKTLPLRPGPQSK